MTDEGTGGGPWADPENARRYAAFARQHPQYRQTSRHLVALAQLRGDASVVDLACGTGVTTEAVLAVLGPGGVVTSVDGSAAMLAMAAAAVADRRVTWIQARAEDLGRHVTGPTDAVVCNSAIWQTQLGAAMPAVRQVLTAGGLFTFNIPAQILADQERLPDPLPAVMRDIAAREYGWAAPPPPPGPPGRPRLTEDHVRQQLSQAGFHLERAERLEYEETPDDLRAWLAIPAFTGRLLPGLPYDRRMRVLSQAWEQAGPAGPRTSAWLAFAARAR
jgi:trans-aconitate methyltransferase